LKLCNSFHGLWFVSLPNATLDHRMMKVKFSNCAVHRRECYTQYYCAW